MLFASCPPNGAVISNALNFMDVNLHAYESGISRALLESKQFLGQVNIHICRCVSFSSCSAILGAVLGLDIQWMKPRMKVMLHRVSNEAAF